MYKNIMLKISGESLAGSNEQGFDFDVLNDLSHSIKKLLSKNLKISIVLGGGNFIRGSSFSNGVVDRVTSDYMGMLGTVINSLALQSNLKKLDVESREKTIEEILNRNSFNNISNLSIHYWKHAFSTKQDNISHFFDEKTQLGICGDSFSVGQVDGAIVSSNEVYRKILSK